MIIAATSLDLCIPDRSNDCGILVCREQTVRVRACPGGGSNHSVVGSLCSGTAGAPRSNAANSYQLTRSCWQQPTDWLHVFKVTKAWLASTSKGINRQRCGFQKSVLHWIQWSCLVFGCCHTTYCSHFIVLGTVEFRCGSGSVASVVLRDRYACELCDAPVLFNPLGVRSYRESRAVL